MALLGIVLDLQAIDDSFRFEGYFGKPTEIIRNMNANVSAFLPYNPIIVEVGAYRGDGTLALAQLFPYSRIYVFEAHPQNYLLLEETLQSLSHVVSLNKAVSPSKGRVRLWGEEGAASLLPLGKMDCSVEVPSVVLDDWCRENEISHIDFLRLDAGGLEWQILQSSPVILKTISVLVVRTHLSPCNRSVISYSLLRKLLEDQGFELFSHWYQENKEGEATFIRKCLYDSLIN